VEGPEIEQPHHHHTGRSWLDLILGVSAVTISFVSLFFAIHNGNAMERLVEANSWPSVQVTFSTLNSDATAHIHNDIGGESCKRSISALAIVQSSTNVGWLTLIGRVRRR
jgi:hypothetical protein